MLRAVAGSGGVHARFKVHVTGSAAVQVVASVHARDNGQERGVMGGYCSKSRACSCAAVGACDVGSSQLTSDASAPPAAPTMLL